MLTKFFQISEKKLKSKFNLGDLVTAIDKRMEFSEIDTATWRYKLYIITESINDTIPTGRINNTIE